MYRFISVFLLLFSYPLYTFALNLSACPQRYCMAVVDAGSSGSRLHIYAYDLDGTNTPVRITEIWNRKALPGLATIEQEHGSIATYMEKLFHDAPASVMPVFFYSTAGMRLLPKTHHKSINQLVSEWFDKQYYWRLDAAKTILGSEEGMYAWLATNYHLNLLNQSEKPLVGVMDIGGASVQIVFPLTNEMSIDPRDRHTIDLYGQRRSVFSHSFLGLGQNEMGHQYFDLQYCYPKKYELPSGVLGNGDLDKCKKEITILVNKVHYVRKKIATVLTTNPVDRWQILGGVTNLLNDKFFRFKAQQVTPSELASLADSLVCHQDWSKLERKNPNNYMLFNYCMLSAYLNALIVNGYNISPTQSISFMPQNKTVDWTLGVVLQHHKT